jgi:hypothetical protein
MLMLFYTAWHIVDPVATEPWLLELFDLRPPQLVASGFANLVSGQA